MSAPPMNASARFPPEPVPGAVPQEPEGQLPEWPEDRGQDDEAGVATGLTTVVRPTQVRGEQRDAEEDEHRADADPQEHRGRPLGAEEAVEDGREADRGEDGANGTRKRARRDGGSVAPSRTAAMGGTLVARTAGRRLATRVTTTPTTIATITVRHWKRRPVLGRVKPARSKSQNRSLASPNPSRSPVSEASDADHERLDDDRAEHLPARGTDRPQRRELARALGDRDRERVGDHEGADEERDATERRAGRSESRR